EYNAAHQIEGIRPNKAASDHEKQSSPALQVRPSQEHPRTHVFPGEACQAAQGLQLPGMQMQQLPSWTGSLAASNSVITCSENAGQSARPRAKSRCEPTRE